MGGIRGGMRRAVDLGVKQGVIKPVLKTPEEGKKLSNALDNKLEENAKGGNKAAAALLVKRKGRKKTILTSAKPKLFILSKIFPDKEPFALRKETNINKYKNIFIIRLKNLRIP